MVRKAVKVTLYEDVMTQIEKMISTEEIKPGERLLPERELADQLGISRNTLREVLKALELVGVLEVKQGGGNYLSESLNSNLVASSLRFMQIRKLKDVFDILQTRRVLEVEIASIAAKRMTPDIVQRLVEINGKIRANYENPELTSQYDLAFHALIAETADNRYLTKLTDVLYEPIRDLMKRTNTEVLNAVEFHEKIISALENRNAADARHYMYEHLKAIETAVREKGLAGIEN